MSWLLASSLLSSLLLPPIHLQTALNAPCERIGKFRQADLARQIFQFAIFHGIPLCAALQLAFDFGSARRGRSFTQPRLLTLGVQQQSKALGAKRPVAVCADILPARSNASAPSQAGARALTASRPMSSDGRIQVFANGRSRATSFTEGPNAEELVDINARSSFGVRRPCDSAT